LTLSLSLALSLSFFFVSLSLFFFSLSLSLSLFLSISLSVSLYLNILTGAVSDQKKVKKPTDKPTKVAPKVLETELGIKYIELKKGSGAFPTPNDFVIINYR
jgi:hypothetical protein